MDAGEIAWIAVMILVCGVGVLLTVLRLPGTWLMVAAAVLASWWSAWHRPEIVHVAILAGLASIGELLEVALSVFTARRAGGSRRAAWGGLVGGVLGMVFLSFLIPVPPFGALAGALVGCFGGALVAELTLGRGFSQSARVGVFSAVGFALGAAAKLAIALAMAALLLAAFVWAPEKDGVPTPMEAGAFATERDDLAGCVADDS